MIKMRNYPPWKVFLIEVAVWWWKGTGFVSTLRMESLISRLQGFPQIHTTAPMNYSQFLLNMRVVFKVVLHFLWHFPPSFLGHLVPRHLTLNLNISKVLQRPMSFAFWDHKGSFFLFPSAFRILGILLFLMFLDTFGIHFRYSPVWPRNPSTRVKCIL